MKFNKVFIIILVVNYCLITTRSFKLDLTNKDPTLKYKSSRDLKDRKGQIVVKNITSSLLYNLTAENFKGSLVFATKRTKDVDDTNNNPSAFNLKVVNNFEINASNISQFFSDPKNSSYIDIKKFKEEYKKELDKKVLAEIEFQIQKKYYDNYLKNITNFYIDNQNYKIQLEYDKLNQIKEKEFNAEDDDQLSKKERDLDKQLQVLGELKNHLLNEIKNNTQIKESIHNKINELVKRQKDVDNNIIAIKKEIKRLQNELKESNQRNNTKEELYEKLSEMYVLEAKLDEERITVVDKIAKYKYKNSQKEKEIMDKISDIKLNEENLDMIEDIIIKFKVDAEVNLILKLNSYNLNITDKVKRNNKLSRYFNDNKDEDSRLTNENNIIQLEIKKNKKLLEDEKSFRNKKMEMLENINGKLGTDERDIEHQLLINKYSYERGQEIERKFEERERELNNKDSFLKNYIDKLDKINTNLEECDSDTHFPGKAIPNIIDNIDNVPSVYDELLRKSKEINIERIKTAKYTQYLNSKEKKINSVKKKLKIIEQQLTKLATYNTNMKNEEEEADNYNTEDLIKAQLEKLTQKTAEMDALVQVFKSQEEAYKVKKEVIDRRKRVKQDKLNKLIDKLRRKEEMLNILTTNNTIHNTNFTNNSLSDLVANTEKQIRHNQSIYHYNLTDFFDLIVKNKLNKGHLFIDQKQFDIFRKGVEKEYIVLKETTPKKIKEMNDAVKKLEDAIKSIDEDIEDLMNKVNEKEKSFLGDEDEIDKEKDIENKKRSLAEDKKQIDKEKADERQREEDRKKKKYDIITEWKKLNDTKIDLNNEKLDQQPKLELVKNRTELINQLRDEDDAIKQDIARYSIEVKQSQLDKDANNTNAKILEMEKLRDQLDSINHKLKDLEKENEKDSKELTDKEYQLSKLNKTVHHLICPSGSCPNVTLPCANTKEKYYNGTTKECSENVYYYQNFINPQLKRKYENIKNYDSKCTDCKFVIVIKFNKANCELITVEESSGKEDIYQKATIEPGVLNLEGFDWLYIQKNMLTRLIANDLIDAIAQLPGATIEAKKYRISFLIDNESTGNGDEYDRKVLQQSILQLNKLDSRFKINWNDIKISDEHFKKLQNFNNIIQGDKSGKDYDGFGLNPQGGDLQIIKIKPESKLDSNPSKLEGGDASDKDSNHGFVQYDNMNNNAKNKTDDSYLVKTEKVLNIEDSTSILQEQLRNKNNKTPLMRVKNTNIREHYLKRLKRMSEKNSQSHSSFIEIEEKDSFRTQNTKNYKLKQITNILNDYDNNSSLDQSKINNITNNNKINNDSNKINIVNDELNKQKLKLPSKVISKQEESIKFLPLLLYLALGLLVLVYFLKEYISRMIVYRYMKPQLHALTYENINDSILKIPEIKNLLYDHEDSYLKLAYGNLLKNSNSLEDAVRLNAFYKVLVNDNYVISINNKIAIAKNESQITFFLKIIQLTLLVCSLILLFLYLVDNYSHSNYFTIICSLFFFLSISLITFCFFNAIYRYDSNKDLNFSRIISSNEDNDISANNFKIVETLEE